MGQASVTGVAIPSTEEAETEVLKDEGLSEIQNEIKPGCSNPVRYKH